MRAKSSSEVHSKLAGIGIGILISMMITLLGVCTLAWLLSRERFPESALGYGVVAVLLLAVITGVSATSSILKSKKMLICVIVGVGYFLFLLACTAMFFGGRYQGIGETALVILAGSISVGLLGLKGNKKQLPTIHKYRNR